MSMIPTFKDLQGGPATNSGIVTKFDSADRVVPESRRPDGTVRKEKKIRPGFSPAEDTKKYRTARMAESEARALPKGMVPGMQNKSNTGASLAIAAANSSAAARKNAKRKEKRKAEGTENKSPSLVPDEWDVEDEIVESFPKANPVVEENTAQDPEKRSRALQKKIKQAEQLKEKADKGEILLPEQSQKVDSLPALIAELDALSLGSQSSKSTSKAVAELLQETSELDAPNTGALPGDPLPDGPVKTSHPLGNASAEEYDPKPDEEQAHKVTKESGKPTRTSVPISAA